MGISFKSKIKESVKDTKEIVEKGKDKETSKEDSKMKDEKELKNDELKYDSKDNKVIQGINEEKRESKWDKIDWNKDISEKKKESKWDKIDWNKNSSKEKKESKFDKIDWRKESSNQKNNINLNDKKSENEKKRDHTNENVKDSKILGKDYNYKNLLDEKVQNTFKTYHGETGNYANYGKNLRKDFIDWVKKTGTDREIISKIDEIQNNQEITNLIKDKIKNSDISQQEISNFFNESGLSVSRRSIGNISLKEVYNYNKDAHHQRFDLSIDPEIKEKIIKRLGEEVENYNEGDQHDSLYKIAKEFPEISKTTVDKIAKKEISQQVYKKMWPSTSGTVPNETREAIRNRLKEEALKKNPYSLRSISDDFSDASHTYVIDLAKEVYPYKHKDLWPVIEKIPNEIRNEIIKTIKDEALKENSRTLKEIHKDFPEVGADSIKRFAKQAVSKQIHDKIWSSEIPEKVKEQIKEILKKEVIKPSPRSLNDIRKEFGIGQGSLIQIAKDVIPGKIYEKLWPAPKEISGEVKNKIINDIKNSKLNLNEIAGKNGVSNTSISNISQNLVFKDNPDYHRERFPNDENFEIGHYNHYNINAILTKTFDKIHNQNYYAEPNIYPDKRRPDGIILEDNNFLQKRLTNPKNGEYLRNALELDSDQLRHIKATQLDLTNDITDENIVNKIEKYQSKDTLFFIIGTRWYSYENIKALPTDKKIKNPENIRVISHNFFADLIGLERENRTLYNKIIKFNYDYDLNSLKALYNYELSFFNTHNTEELKQDLIQKNLIKENFDEYFNFELTNKEDNNEKQLDLDYFLNI